MTDRQYQKILRRLDLLEQREPPLAAEFVDTATDPSDDLRVVAPGWDDGEHTFGPVRWSPMGGALPQAGDECVIVERDDGVWQVVGWQSDRQAGSSPVRFPVSIDLYGPQSQEAFSLVGTSAAVYTSPGSAFSSSAFEFYTGLNASVSFAVWQVVWTPTNSGVGIELIKFDAGPTNIVQISEITGHTGGPLNDSQDVTAAIRSIIDGTAALGPHKQIGHRLKGDGAVAAKVYMSRVSIMFEI